ncbi:MAG: HNH endonuclease [Planctomycetes bacterium]|nr:HNH endonuclease [Planctomycetota bacterium]
MTAVTTVTTEAAASSSGLDASVLVLNRLFMAVRVVRARHAFVLLWKQIAEVVSVEDETFNTYDFSSWTEVSQYRRQFQPESHDWVKTVRFEIAVPRVIRLLTYDRLPKTRVRLNRRNLFARDANRCQYCGRRFRTTELSIDHVLPRSRGGRTLWTNVVCACMKCNVRKGGRTPDEAHMKLICEPKQPRVSPVISLHAGNEKYRSWKQFLDTAYWHVELRD